MGLTLAWLLHRGVRVADDFRLRLGWSVRGDEPVASGARASSSDKSWGLGMPEVADLEGSLFVVVLALTLGVLVGTSFLLAEVMLPLLFGASYWVMNQAIARVANDRHECAGHLGRSLRWGLAWSTLYVGPLALLAWALHQSWRP